MSILWGWCAIAVFNSRMSQVLVQFVDQYIKLAGSGARERERKKKIEPGYVDLDS